MKQILTCLTIQKKPLIRNTDNYWYNHVIEIKCLGTDRSCVKKILKINLIIEIPYRLLETITRRRSVDIYSGHLSIFNVLNLIFSIVTFIFTVLCRKYGNYLSSLSDFLYAPLAPSPSKEIVEALNVLRRAVQHSAGEKGFLAASLIWKHGHWATRTKKTNINRRIF